MDRIGGDLQVVFPDRLFLDFRAGTLPATALDRIPAPGAPVPGAAVHLTVVGLLDQPSVVEVVQQVFLGLFRGKMEKFRKIENKYKDYVNKIKIEPTKFFTENPQFCLEILASFVALKKQENPSIQDNEAQQASLYEIYKIRESSIFNDVVFQKFVDLIKVILILLLILSLTFLYSCTNKNDTSNVVPTETTTTEAIISDAPTPLENAEVQNQLFTLTRQEITDKLMDKSHPLSIMQETAYKAMLCIIDDMDSEDPTIRSNAIKNYSTMFNNGKALTIKDVNLGIHLHKNVLLQQMHGKKN